MNKPISQQEESDEQAVAMTEAREQVSPNLRARIPTCGVGGLCSGQRIYPGRCLRCGL
jgi:hypothetical protein